MGMANHRRRIVGIASASLLLALGAVLTWHSGLSPSSASRPDAAGGAWSGASGLGMTDRAYSSWPVDETPPASMPATRAGNSRLGPTAVAVPSPGISRGQDALAGFTNLSAGPASLPNGNRNLDAPAPAGLGTSVGADERDRLLNDGSATEAGLAPAPRRDRPAVRVRIPDDDHCVPRPPPRF